MGFNVGDLVRMKADSCLRNDTRIPQLPFYKIREFGDYGIFLRFEGVNDGWNKSNFEPVQDSAYSIPAICQQEPTYERRREEIAKRRNPDAWYFIGKQITFTDIPNEGSEGIQRAVDALSRNSLMGSYQHGCGVVEE